MNRNGTRKETQYNLGHQCIIPTYKCYWKETKDKYKRRDFSWARYMQEPIGDIYLKITVNLFSITNLKSTNIFLKHQRYEYYLLQEVKKGLFKYALN